MCGEVAGRPHSSLYPPLKRAAYHSTSPFAPAVYASCAYRKAKRTNAAAPAIVTAISVKYRDEWGLTLLNGEPCRDPSSGDHSDEGAQRVAQDRAECNHRNRLALASSRSVNCSSNRSLQISGPITTPPSTRPVRALT